MDQQTDTRQTLHTRCALERTVLINEVIVDDDEQKGCEYSARGRCLSRWALAPKGLDLPARPLISNLEVNHIRRQAVSLAENILSLRRYGSSSLSVMLITKTSDYKVVLAPLPTEPLARGGLLNQIANNTEDHR